MRFFRKAQRADPDPQFLELLAETSLTTMERQRAFEAWVGYPDWQLDQGAGELRLGDDLFPAELLGTYADKSRTWLWAWANDSVESRMLSAVSAARSIGEERGIAVLTEPEFDVDRVGTAARLALATVGLIGGDAVYACPYPGGTAYVVVDLPETWTPSFPPIEERVVHTITEALSEAPELVSRDSVERYLREIDAPMTVGEDGIRIGECTTLEFDELGRLTRIEATFE